MSSPANNTHVDIAIVGAGACGLVAALAASDVGVTPLLLERDATPSGSTALSSGMIPACGTRWQQLAGVADSVSQMMADMTTKAANGADSAVVAAVCQQSATTLEWLADQHGIEFELVQGFLYPGHSAARMHAPPARTGAALQDALLQAVARAGVPLLTQAQVADVIATGSRVQGVLLQRPDGAEERLECSQLVLACNGYGGAADLVARYIPTMRDALYFGHAGNQGDALRWGKALGAQSRHLGAYQGHGSVAIPQQILITWAIMMEGGIQVNQLGQRFSNEHLGYSEQAEKVLAQPQGIAWSVFDQRLHQLGLEFVDYQRANELGAIKVADSIADLAQMIAVDESALAGSIVQTETDATDQFGRDFSATPALRAPYYAVRVTGALFHTQGGLKIDPSARVLDSNDEPLPNLWAAGGAACGLSGASVAGYLSGNGLLSATVLGKIAGSASARACRESA